LVAGGWFVVREKYCWLVADKLVTGSKCSNGDDRLQYTAAQHNYD
jgi:hypothetical protein